ncbi:C40 family peptidase [Butyrivibrio sp. AC2005]|uniref:C40 family peptidase n=1 Tax=Butyrivibrio sp. AC2005 TaxID=1280672 RepID=UPI0003F9088C|nr:NlpC/P60 family protein [Butyrivibrio sp. AC2005]
MTNEFDDFNDTDFGEDDLYEDSGIEELSEAEYLELIGEEGKEQDSELFSADEDSGIYEDTDSKKNNRKKAKDKKKKGKKRSEDVGTDKSEHSDQIGNTENAFDGDSFTRVENVSYRATEEQDEEEDYINRSVENRSSAPGKRDTIIVSSTAKKRLEGITRNSSENPKENAQDNNTEEHDYSRKFKAHGDKSGLVEALSRGGKAVASAVVSPTDETDSPDEEQKRDLRNGMAAVRDAMDTLSDMGDKASSDLQKRESLRLMDSCGELERGIAEGRIDEGILEKLAERKGFGPSKKDSFEEEVQGSGGSGKSGSGVGQGAHGKGNRDSRGDTPHPSAVLTPSPRGGRQEGTKDSDGRKKDGSDKRRQGKKRNKKELEEELKQCGVSNENAAFIVSHGHEVRDYLKAKKVLKLYLDKQTDKKHAFAKTKVKGKSVKGLSRIESSRQRKLLESDNKVFFDKHGKSALTKNMIRVYFRDHDDEIFRRINPAFLSQQDLKRFIKGIESGKIHVKKEYLDEVLPLLRTYERAMKAQKVRKTGRKSVIGGIAKRGLYRAYDYYRYTDDGAAEGYRNAITALNGVKAVHAGVSLTARTTGKIVKINNRINPVNIAGRAVFNKVIKPGAVKFFARGKKGADKTTATAGGSQAVSGTKAASGNKTIGKATASNKAGAVSNVSGTGNASGVGKIWSKPGFFKGSGSKRGGASAQEMPVKGGFIHKSRKVYRKAVHTGRKVKYVAGIPFVPIKVVKKGIGKAVSLFRKIAMYVFVAVFLLVLILILMLVFSAAIQSLIMGQGTLFESTIFDEGMPGRIEKLKQKDIAKYQEAIDVALAPPKHDEEHIDSRGLYPDEALYGVRLYHYGSPANKDSEDAGIYHNNIAGDTTNGYHIYFLDSEGRTIGNSTTNIKDVMCLSAVMADNYFDDKYVGKIDELQADIFDILNPVSTYTVSELYHKEGNDRFPFDGYTFEQSTYFCNDGQVYADAQSAKDQGVVFYSDLVPKTEKGCSFDEESYDSDFDSWLEDMPSLSDYLPSWSDYAPNIDDYEDGEGNIDYDSYNVDYAAAETRYDEDYKKGEENYNNAKSVWDDSKPDINDEKYRYCPGHPVPGKDGEEDDPVSVSYGYRDINIYVTVLTKNDVYKAFESGNGIIRYKAPKNYECTEFEEKEIVFSLADTYCDMLSEFYRNDGWKSRRNIEWCEDLYNNDWNDIYGIDVYSDTTELPSGKGALSEQQINEIIENIGDVSEVREAFVNYAISYVGQISYYWGGKPDVSGWDGNGFGTVVDADYKGRSKKGLDCSGFVSWVYWSVTGIKPPGMSTNNLTKGLHLSQISYSQIKPGDIGFISAPGAKSNHVGIFVGIDEDSGRGKWVHCSGVPRNTVVLDTTNMFSVYYRMFD